MLISLNEVLNSLDYTLERIMIFIWNLSHFTHELHVIDLSCLVLIQELNESVYVFLFDSFYHFLESNFESFGFNSAIVQGVSLF